MKKVFGIFGILVILFIAYLWFFVFHGRGHSSHGPKPVPLAVSKHSEAFNKSIGEMLEAYYKMEEGFVNWDTVVINLWGNELKRKLDSLSINELQKDTVIYLTALDPIANAKTEAISIISDPSMDEKRGSFNILSDNIRNLLVTVKYDQAKIYWQECPMAFGEDKPGNWLSRTKEIRNPYLGTKDPKYGKDMLECGSPKDTINFMLPDSTQK